MGSQAPRALAPAPPCLPHLRDVLQVDAVVPIETWLAVVDQHVTHPVRADRPVDPVVVDGGEGEVFAHAVGEVVEFHAGPVLLNLAKREKKRKKERKKCVCTFLADSGSRGIGLKVPFAVLCCVRDVDKLLYCRHPKKRRNKYCAVYYLKT